MNRPNHRAAAERLLADADEWTAQAGELDPEASELSCLAYAAVHALLAIHDTLTALKPEPATYAALAAERGTLATSVERVRALAVEYEEQALREGYGGELWSTTAAAIRRALKAATDTGDAADRYAANEAKQREAEADPLDENDHRDRIVCDGGRIVRNGQRHWHTPLFGPANWCDGSYCGSPSLADWDRRFGPLTFAPEPPPDAARDDLSASEGESGSVEGEGADDAPEALLCPDCGHDLEDHCEYCCGCPRSPSGVAYTLLADAVKAEREAGTDG